MAGILIYSDKTSYAFELISAAKLTGKEIKAITINDADQAEALSQKGAEVHKIDNPNISLADPAAVAEAVKQAAEQLGTDVIFLSSNRRGKELAGRAAQKMGAGCLTNVSALNINGDKIEGVRNALGGATVATQTIESEKQIIALSPKSFAPAEDAAGSVQEMSVDVTSTVKFIDSKIKQTDSVDIEAAEVLVAVGQGLDEQGDLKTVEAIAKALGGEVACSKPVATDKKWLSEERIIGISGKTCKPELAVLMGISGQVQFVAGIRDAKTIVAINSDENATIMSMADYVLVADLKDALPELEKALS